MRVWIPVPGHLRKHLLVEVAAGLEAIVPDVEWLEITIQTFFDQVCNFLHLLRRTEISKESLHIFLRNLHPSVESPLNVRRVLWCVRINQFHCLEIVEKGSIPGVGLWCRNQFFTLFVNFVGRDIPLQVGIIYHHFRDILVDDMKHHFIDHLLLKQSFIPFVIIGFQLVAQVPVGEEFHILVEMGLHLIIHKMAYPDVVIGNIVVGSRESIRNFLIDLGRYTRSEYIAHSGISPLQASPPFSIRCLLLKCKVREIQCRDESDFVGKEIICKMGARTVCCEDLIEIEHFIGRQVYRLFQPQTNHVKVSEDGFIIL